MECVVGRRVANKLKSPLLMGSSGIVVLAILDSQFLLYLYPHINADGAIFGEPLYGAVFGSPIKFINGTDSLLAHI